MFCYYNYLVVFGGQGNQKELFGDLWIFDIINHDWHEIMDAKNIHNLVHQNVEGFIPSPRAFMAGTLNERFGAAFITGGKLEDSNPACDMWVLNLEMMVQFIERPDDTTFQNIWERKDVKEQELFCRWGHSSAFVNTRYMLVFGGVNFDRKVV